jgi:hypothetical protein
MKKLLKLLCDDGRRGKGRGAVFCARTASFQRSEPLWKRLPVGAFHVSDRVVQRVADEAREWAVSGPIHGIAKPLEQREGQRDGYPLLPQPRWAGIGSHGTVRRLGNRCIECREHGGLVTIRTL